MPLGFIGFPHVADCASLVVNVRLLILQPLVRLCVRCRISVMNWKPAILTARAVTSSITHIGAAGDYVGRGKTLPIIYNRGAVADSVADVIRIFSNPKTYMTQSLIILCVELQGDGVGYGEGDLCALDERHVLVDVSHREIECHGYVVGFNHAFHHLLH